MRAQVREVARAIGARVIGDDGAELCGVASILSAAEEDLVFVEDEKNFDAALSSRAGAIIAGRFAERTKTAKTLLIVSHPRLAFALAAKLLQQGEERKGGVDPAAIILPTAKIGQSVTIGPW